MNHRDTQIEEYIRGRMPEGARREFETKMAANPALRRSVEAEQAIVSTIRRDAAANAAAESAEIPAFLSAKLASTSAAVALPQMAGTGVLGTIFGTKVGITVLSIVGGIGVILGVLLIAPLFNDSPAGGKESRIEVRNNRNGEGISPTGTGQDAESGADRTSISAADPEGDGTASLPSSASAQEKNTGEGKASAKKESGSRSGRKGDARFPVASASPDANAKGAPDTTPNTAAEEMLKQLRQEENSRRTPRVKKGSAEVQVEIDN